MTCVVNQEPTVSKTATVKACVHPVQMESVQNGLMHNGGIHTGKHIEQNRLELAQSQATYKTIFKRFEPLRLQYYV